MQEPTLTTTRAADLLAEAREELAREARSGEDTSAAAARWLCLVPAWTPVLAARCALPGCGGDGDDAVIERWRAEGLVEVSHTPISIDDTGRISPPQHLFWMPRQARTAWLSRLVSEDGRNRMVALTRDIAARILAQPNDHDMPSATWRWATVAAHATGTPPPLSAIFEHELTEALAHSRTDEAWLWIEALQRVADVVPGEATTLHQRAVRRLALFDRQRNDRALLRDYLPRPALFEAYRALVAGPDDMWGLHYLGGGGVGKTMLMRALTSGTEQHLPAGLTLPAAVTARIDFDHIDPDYPARRPGLLFAHLAEELRLKDDSLRASEGFALLFNKIALMHERGGAEATTNDEIEEMLDVFAWACDAVARACQGRVVLLLDTCEELARLGPDGVLPQSVERTFDLLERLHGKLPSLRVVFCGRRPLAGTYADGVAVTAQLPTRPWLHLHRVSAFSEREAKEFLQRTGVPDRLVAPILSRSVAAASSAALGLVRDPEPRYSPFSLSVYSTWVDRQKDVEPETILGDRVDHFVRVRILDRIHNPDVRRLLPHVALLGRFDEPTLRACVDLRPDVASVVLREIASQEWVDSQAGGYFAVEGELCARLLAYFERESPAELRDAHRRVLPALWSLFDATPADDLPDEAVVQALVQLVQADRDGMLRAWRRLDARIVSLDQPAWGVRLLGRLLASDDALASDTVDAGAWSAMVATYAECVARQQGPSQAAEYWRQAWEGAQHLEDPVERTSVLVRIASGGLAGAAVAPDTEMAFDMWALRLYNLLSDRAVDLLTARLDGPGHGGVQAQSAVAAMMVCADAAERQRDPLQPAPPLLERIASIATGIGNLPARAIALTCVGRFASRRQDADLAHRRFAEALTTIADAHERELVPSLHWRAGLDAASWVTLEALRGLAGLEPVEDTLERFSSSAHARSAVAANRIESLRLRLSAAIRVPEELTGTESRRAALIVPADVAPVESLGQEVVPPRAVSVAQDHVERGRPVEGLRLLSELVSVATSARNTVVATAAERARIEAVTRMRLGEHGRLSRQLLTGASTLTVEERERMRAFVPEANAQAFDDESVVTRWDAHAIWRAMRAGNEQERQRLAAAGRRLLALRGIDGTGEWARASVALDLVECGELGADPDVGAPVLTPVSPEDWWSRHPALPEYALRLWIRSAALGVSPGGPTSVLVRRIGVRRAAAIAMEEAELLALRLPSPALRLLALALTWYEDAHDVVGIWQVTALLAITRVRAGIPRDSIDLTSLRLAHAPLVGSGSGRTPFGLPPWTWIEGVTQLPVADAPVAPEWTPWLHRVVAVHHWVVAGVRPEVLFTTTHDTGNGRRMWQYAEWLPVELRDWPTDPLAGSVGGTTETNLKASPGIRETSAPSPSPPVPPRVEPASAPGPWPLPSPPAQVPVPMQAPRAESASVPIPIPEAGPTAVRTQTPLIAMSLGLLLFMLLVLWWLLLPSGPSPTGASDTVRRDDAVSSIAPDVDRPEPAGAAPSSGATTSAPGPGVETAPKDAEAEGTVVYEEGDAIVGGRLFSPLPLVVGLAAAVALLIAGGWFVLRRRTATSDAVSYVPTWTATVSASGEGHASRMAPLDVQVAMADDDGRPVTAVAMRVRRTDAYSGLDALRQPPAGPALSMALPTTPPLERLWLDLAPATAWPSWEVLLWSGAVDGVRLSPAVVRRVRASRPARAMVPSAGVPHVATIAATPADERQATYGWEPSLKAGRVTVTGIAPEAVRVGVPLPGVRIVHVTAQPVETPHGLYFEVTAGPQVKESLESLVNDRGTLFDAMQLEHTFPDASCLLLQPPRRPTLDVTPAGRETCASLRIIGAALAEQGVPVVIVLPPLDGELSAHVVRLLGRRVPRWFGQGPVDPHEFTIRARELVHGHAQRQLPPDAAIELALLVTVYAS